MHIAASFIKSSDRMSVGAKQVAKLWASILFSSARRNDMISEWKTYTTEGTSADRHVEQDHGIASGHGPIILGKVMTCGQAGFLAHTSRLLSWVRR